MKLCSGIVDWVCVDVVVDMVVWVGVFIGKFLMWGFVYFVGFGWRCLLKFLVLCG